MTGFTISKAARAADVNVETIRFYERRGLINQPRTPAQGYREYPPETVEQIRFIRQAQEIGFALRDIQELLALRTDPEGDCADVRLRAVAKLDDVNAKIDQLRTVKHALETLIAACPGQGALGSCSILNEITSYNARSRSAAASPHQTAQETTTMVTTEFAIEGMHCSGCAKTVSALLLRVPGVRHAEVSYAEQRARVLHDPDTAAVADIQAAIGQAGYSAKDLAG